MTDNGTCHDDAAFAQRVEEERALRRRAVVRASELERELGCRVDLRAAFNPSTLRTTGYDLVIERVT